MTAADEAEIQAAIRAAAQRVAAAGESPPRVARDPVNLPMIRNWTEALGDDNAKPAANDVRFDPHIQETADDLAGTPRMKGCQNQMASEGSLQGNLGGRFVADLADGDHFGVLTQK